MCIKINGEVYKTEYSYVTGKTWVFYRFYSSPNSNGLYADGDWQTADPLPGENEEKAIQITMSYLNIPRTEICGQELPPCTPNWKIGAWSTCQPDNTQTRTVIDLNNCNIITGKPSTI